CEDHRERGAQRRQQQHRSRAEGVPEVEVPGRRLVPRQDQRRDHATDARERRQLSGAQLHTAPQAPSSSTCRRAACTVLRSSIAIVIGPTPPGTGVIAEASSATASWSTSPTSPLLFAASSGLSLLMPTSITTAPGLTYPAPIARGLPIAATS